MSAPETPVTTAHRQRGFSLIEALIAFVILAVGIIGIISLLLMSKNTLKQSNQRSLAVNLADVMVEKIRINPAGAASYVTPTGGLGGGKSTTPSKDCKAVLCNATELATYDLRAWEDAMDGKSVQKSSTAVGGLSEPHACITFTADAGKVRSGRLNIRIQWHGLSKTSDAVTTAANICGTVGTAAGQVNDFNQDPYRRQVSVNTMILDEWELL